MTVEQLAEATDKFGAMAVLIAVVCFILLIVITAMLFIMKSNNKHNQQMLDRLISKNDVKAQTPHESKKEGEDIALVYSRSVKILQKEAQQAHDICRVDRIGIYMFHNGATAISGFPFLKKTCVAEWVTLPHMRRRAYKERDISLINTFPFVEEWQELSDTGYIEIKYTPEFKEAKPQEYYYLEARGIKQMVAVAIKDNEGYLIGYVDAEWTSLQGDEDEEKIKLGLKALAEKVGVVLQFTSFKELKQHLDIAEEESK